MQAPTTKRHFTSFMEVSEGEGECIVTIGGSPISLGEIRRIYSTDPGFIVWGDGDEKIWYEHDPAKQLDKTFYAFWSEWQSLVSQSFHNLELHQIKNFQTMMASALAIALRVDGTVACDTMQRAREFLAVTNERAAKRRYTVGVLALASVSFLSAVLGWRWLQSQPDFAYLPALGFLALGGGSVGALLSSLSGTIRDARFDPDASALDGYLTGAFRVLYGVCGALVVLVAVQSGVLKGSTPSAHDQILPLLLVAFGGGFTERQAANIIRRAGEHTR